MRQLVEALVQLQLLQALGQAGETVGCGSEQAPRSVVVAVWLLLGSLLMVA